MFNILLFTSRQITSHNLSI